VATPVPEIRKLMDHMAFPPADLPMHEVREIDIPGGDGQPLKLRLYRPGTAQAAPVMVYFHGGGWCIGTLETHDNLCRHLARLTGMNLVSVDYRLAPEHVFPAALDDAYAATRWVALHAAELHCDARQLMVAGDSAGAIWPSPPACAQRRRLERHSPATAVLSGLRCAYGCAIACAMGRCRFSPPKPWPRCGITITLPCLHIHWPPSCSTPISLVCRQRCW
jgi:poly(3-hydroxybutyrate) depolymerase